MSLVLLLLLNMFRMLVHPSSLCRLKHCFSLHRYTTPPQPNHTVTPAHIEPEQYNTWNKSTISRKLLKMDVLTFETCWAANSEIIKQVTSSWSIFIQLWKFLLMIKTVELYSKTIKLNLHVLYVCGVTQLRRPWVVWFSHIHTRRKRQNGTYLPW